MTSGKKLRSSRSTNLDHFDVIRRTAVEKLLHNDCAMISHFRYFGIRLFVLPDQLPKILPHVGYVLSPGVVHLFCGAAFSSSLLC